MSLPLHNLFETVDVSKGVPAVLALLKSLANIDRLAILCSLIETERSVGDLEGTLNISQPTLSQQLARLRSDELVSTRRDGKVIYYCIASKNAEQVIEVLHGLYCS